LAIFSATISFFLLMVTLRLTIADKCLQNPNPTQLVCDVDNVPDNFSATIEHNATHLQLKSQNQLTLQNKTFSGLDGLVTLRLSNNSIVGLPDRVFEPLKNIEEINLSRNKLTSINLDQFANNQKLQKLHLEFNRIKVVQPIHHKGEFSIREIWINNNKLVDVSEMCKVRKLKVLTLSNNPDLNFDSFEFSCWNELTHLYLRHTNLKRMDNNYQTFAGLMKLEFLDLGGNELEWFVKFPQLRKLTFLDISRNKLSSVNVTELKKTFERLEKVNLNDNPWICSQMNIIFKGLKDQHITFDDWSQTGCVLSPENLISTHFERNPSVEVNLSLLVKIVSTLILFVVDIFLSYFVSNK
jgi:Leucine-rich repeat (LRR) protein